MPPRYSPAEAKSILIGILYRDVSLHESGRYDALGADYDEVDARLPREAGPEFSTSLLAFEFWSGWLDSAEHDWLFYEPLRETDWPMHARSIARDLEANRPITDPVLLSLFGPKTRSPWSWIRSFVERRR